MRTIAFRRTWPALLVPLALTPALAPAFVVNLLRPPTTPWQSPDATLGITGYTTFDFESTTLPAGVTASVTSPAGSYAATNTLPFLFDPAVDDPNGAKVFVPGIWDGSHVFVNRLNQAVPPGYADAPTTRWGAFTFTFPAGTTSAGFSMGNIDLGQNLSINGGAPISLGSFNVPSNRNGFLRVDADPGETISSLSITSNGGDGYAVDHLAFSVIPEPTTPAILTLAAAAAARTIRRRQR